MSQNERLLLGTAGHIDHGKTALIRALTGQDTDRLTAEKERGISIELGFAHYEAAGHRFGVVDVPGHERFIRQMLAGVHGIDLVLFTVAADDGIMPQTEEHFDILHLLGARNGIFVVTKADLVPEERLDEVRSDIEVLAVGTSCERWPVLSVSSTTGLGLDALREELGRQLDRIPRRETGGYFRLPIDRAFTLHGHGLVVTGTALAGEVREGDGLTLLPGGENVRARSIQVHGDPVKVASAGQRVAVNLPGVGKEAAGRGHWLVDPRLEDTTDRFDCLLEVRPGASRPLRSFDRLRIYLSTAEILGRVILLDGRKELEPKQSGWCQIALEEPVVATWGDRFIARTETATRTMGGGRIIHPFAPRHRPSEPSPVPTLAALSEGEPDKRMHAFLELLREFAAPTALVAQAMGTTFEEIGPIAAHSPHILPLPDAQEPEAWTISPKWDALRAEITDVLQNFHRIHPIAAGMDLESLRSRLRTPLSAKLFRPVIARLEASGVVAREQSDVRLAEHEVKLDESQSDRARAITTAIESGGLTPPDAKQIAASMNMTAGKALELLHLLERERKAVRVAPEIFYHADAYQRARRLFEDIIADKGEVTVADYRTALSASRKYALALLEHFDETGITVRIGDARRLRST